MGGYLLVRREAYERVGGRKSINGKTMDKMLAMRLKQGGLRVVLAFGVGMAEACSPGSFAGVWRGWTRILAGTFDNSLAVMTGIALNLLLVDVLLYTTFAGAGTALLLGGAGTLLWALFILSGVTIATAMVLTARYCRSIRTDARFAVLHLAGCLVVLGIVVVSLWSVASGRGFKWKGQQCDARALSEG